MAKMGGCNANFEKRKEPQGKNRVTPGDWDRNNMSMGGVNGHAGGTDKWGEKSSVKAKGAAQGKHHHMPKPY